MIYEGTANQINQVHHIDELAGDVIGVMEHLHLERAHIVCSSLGAEVGLSMAANYPKKVISLVCDGALASEYGPYGLWGGSQADFEEYIAGQLANFRVTPKTLYPSIDALVENRRGSLEEYGWWNEYVEAVERYGAYKVDGGIFTRGMGVQALEEYMENYYHIRFEDYYRKVRCRLLMLPGDEELGNERERAAMEGLRDLAEQGELVEVSGWVHPYGWLLNPEGACKKNIKIPGRHGLIKKGVGGSGWVARINMPTGDMIVKDRWQMLPSLHPINYMATSLLQRLTTFFF